MTVITRLVLVAFSVVAIVACDGSELELGAPGDATLPDTTPDTEDTSGDVTPDVPDTASATVSFIFVTAGGVVGGNETAVTLAPSDEPTAYLDTPGFQVDIAVQMQGVAEGTNVTLRIAGQARGAANAVASGAAGASTAGFTEVTVPPTGAAPVAICVETEDQAGNAISDCKDVTLVGPCDVEITFDASDQGCALLGSSGGTLSAAVTVQTNTAGCDSATLSYSFGETADTIGPLPLIGGALVFTPVLGNEGDDLFGELSVSATVTHETDDEALQAELSAAIQVDNVVPDLALVQPDPTGSLALTWADDKDANSFNGVQVDISGTTDLPDTAVDGLTLTIDGADVATATPSAGEWVFSDVTFATEGAYSVTVRASDECANATVTSVELAVVLAVDEVTISAPADTTVLLAVDDLDPASAQVYDTDFSVVVSNPVEGATITLECSANVEPAEWLIVGTVMIDGGDLPDDNTFTFRGALPVALLGTDVTCRASVDLPTAITSGQVGLTLALPAPTLTLTGPVPGACDTSKRPTLSGTATGLDGQPVRVIVTDASDAEAFDMELGTISDDAFSVEVDLTSLADGPYNLTVDATDTFGNVVSDTQPEIAVLAFNFDANGPTLALRAPQDATILDPANVAAHADSDPGTAGYQVDFDVEVTDLNNVGGEVCLSVNEAVPVCQTVADTSDTTTDALSFADVTLQIGVNNVTISGDDACGNPATSVGASVSVVDVPVVTITSPAADSTTREPTVDIEVSVTQSDGTTPIDDATVTCTVDGDDAGAATNNADGTYSFTAVALSTDTANAILCQAVAAGGTGVSDTRTLTHSTVIPVVSITTPASDLTTIAETVDITVAVFDTDGTTPIDDATVTCTVSGSDAGTATNNTDGTYSFSAVALTLGAANAIVCQATAGGAPGTSATRTVTQKNVLPTITITAPGEGTLNLDSSECAGSGGDCDTTVSATTTNAEDDSTVVLTVDCDGDESTASGTVASDAVSFANVILTDQTLCTLSAVVTDLYGQTGTSADVDVTVDRSAPEVDLTSPSGSSLSSFDDNDAAAGVQHPLTVDVTGADGQVVSGTLTDGDGGAIDEFSGTADGDDATLSFEDTEGAGWVTFPDGTVVVTISVADAAGNTTTLVRTLSVEDEVLSIGIDQPPYSGDDACTDSCALGICDDGKCWDLVGIDSIPTLRVVATGITAAATPNDQLRVCTDNAAVADSGAADCGGGFHELLLTDVTAGINFVSLDSAITEGFHELIVQVETTGNPANPIWVSTDADAVPGEQRRRFFVDLAEPSVSDFVSPSDTDAPSGKLSNAEQTQLGGYFNVSFDASEAGEAEIFADGVSIATGTVVAGDNTIEIQLDDGDHILSVVVTDAVGNANPAPPAAGATTLAVSVDTLPPTLAFQQPSQAVLNAASDLDVILNSDAEGQLVTLFDDGAMVDMVAVSGGQAIFDDLTYGALTDGPHTLSASVSDGCGNTTTAETDPASIDVDTLPPVGNISVPSAGATLTDEDDDAPRGGFQLSVTFDTAQGADTWRLLAAVNCDSSHASCDADEALASGAVTNPGGSEPAEVIDINAASPYQQLAFETTDSAGNTHITRINLTFNLIACRISIVELPPAPDATHWFNASYCSDGPSCDSAEVTIKAALSGDCASSGVDTIELSVDGEVQTLSPGATTTDFSVTLGDGDAGDISGRALAGATPVATSSTHAFEADFSPPTVAFQAKFIDPFTTPAEGASVTWTAADDLNPSEGGMQFHVSVSVTDANVAGGQITGLDTEGVSSGSASLLTSAIDLTGPSPEVVDILNRSVADNDTHEVTVTANDAAGNVGTSSFTATVDVTGPGVVEITAVNVDFLRRSGYLISMTAPAGVASYEYRYSYAPIDNDNFDAACDILGVGIDIVVPDPGDIGPVGETDTWQIMGPDPRPFTDTCKLDLPFEDDLINGSDPAIYFAARAVDDAGNKGFVDPDLSVDFLTRDDVQMQTSRLNFNFDVGAGFRGSNLFMGLRTAAAGDVDKDGFQDILVGSSNIQGFCLLDGPLNIAGDEATISGTSLSGTVSGIDYDCIANDTAFFGDTGQEFPRQLGSHLTGVGDVNGDGVDDFGVSGKFGVAATGTEYTGEGYVLIFLGRTDLGPDLSAPAVIIDGISVSTNLSAYNGFCGAGDFDGVDNGSGPADDLVIGAPGANTAYVITGDTDWETGSTVVLDAATAAVMAFTTTAPLFGVRCQPAGDVIPTPAGAGADGLDDVLVLQSDSADARLFVLAGRSVFPAADAVLTASLGSPTVIAAGDDPSDLTVTPKVSGMSIDIVVAGTSTDYSDSYEDTTKVITINSATDGDGNATTTVAQVADALLTTYSHLIDTAVGETPTDLVVDVGVTDLAPTAEDEVSLRLRQDLPGFRTGFGGAFESGIDYTSDGIPDILVSNGGRNISDGGDGRTIYLFDGSKLPGALGTDHRIQGTDKVGLAYTSANGFVMEGEIWQDFRGVTGLKNLDAHPEGAFTGRPVELQTPDLGFCGKNEGLGADIGEVRFNGGPVFGRFASRDGEFVSPFSTGQFSACTSMVSGFNLDGSGGNTIDIVTGTLTGSILIIR